MLFDRSIVIPSQHMGGVDATLEIDSPDGETATMRLVVLGETVAEGERFRRGGGSRWTWLDAPETEVAGTFGAFLAHALESSEEYARDGWPILTDAASDWTDTLALLAEVDA